MKAAEWLRRRIEELQRLRGMTNVDLAWHLRTTPENVSQLINGHRRLRVEHLDGLAQAFNVTVADLFVRPSRAWWERLDRRSVKDRRKKERRSGTDRRQVTWHPAAAQPEKLVKERHKKKREQD